LRPTLRPAGAIVPGPGRGRAWPASRSVGLLHVAAQLAEHGRRRPAQPLGDPADGFVALHPGENLLPLGESQEPSGRWDGDVGRNHSASLTEPVLPGVLVQPQRHGGPLLGQARPDQQPELPLQLPSPRYIAAHSNTLLGLRVLRSLLEPKGGAGGGSFNPARNFGFSLPLAGRVGRGSRSTWLGTNRGSKFGLSG